MGLVIDEVLRAALDRSSESAEVDFKSSFDVGAPGEWLALLKDLAAMANSGGGIILFGLDDGGQPSHTDVSQLLGVDPADLTNKIYKYTGSHFHAFEIIECEKCASQIVAMLIGDTKIPVVFTRVGTFEPMPGQQKTIFSVGTVYFRHGAKSEPGNSEDLRQFVERRLEEVKKFWMEGITKVVEAPTGSRIAIVPPESQPSHPAGVLPLQFTSDPSAPAYYAVPIDKTHPFRQKEVVVEVNSRLGQRKHITRHDILCIRRVHEVQKNIEFCYTQNYASPRYSPAFVDWIIGEFERDSAFFDKAKERFDALKHLSDSRPDMD